MLCNKCSNPVSESEKFCPVCGAPIVKSSSIEDEATVIDTSSGGMDATVAAFSANNNAYRSNDEVTVVAGYNEGFDTSVVPPVQNGGYQMPQQPVAPPQYVIPASQPPQKKNTGMIIAISVVSVIAVAALIIVILFVTGVFDNKGGEETSTEPVSQMAETEKESGSETENKDEEITDTVTEAPTNLRPVNDEAAIRNASETYYDALVSGNVAKYKASMPRAYVKMMEKSNLFAEMSASELEEIKGMGINPSSPDAVFEFLLKISVIELGVDVIDIKVNTVNFNVMDDEYVDAFNQGLAEEGLAGYKLEGYAEAKVTITVTERSGKTRTVNQTVDYAMEDGIWKLIPMGDEEDTSSEDVVTPPVTNPYINEPVTTVPSPDNNTVTVPSGKISRGKINGNTYTNSFLGLTFTKPSSWVFGKDSDLATMSGLQLSDMSKDVGVLMQTNQAFFDMMCATSTGDSNIIIGYESLTVTNAEDITVEEYFNNMKSLSESSGISYKYGEIKKDTLGGETFYSMSASTKVVVDIYQKTYITKKDNVIAMVIITAQSEEQINELAAMFS